MLKGFKKVADMPQDIIKRYHDKVPNGLIEIWEEDGLGTFLGGYLKVINPKKYLELVQRTYFRGEDALPIFVTAFGDIITLENGEFIAQISYKTHTCDILIKRVRHFINNIDSHHLSQHFELELYKEAINKFGPLDYNQCFGFVPLLALGGPKSVDHLSKVKIFEHILLITQLVGPIGM